MSIAYRPAWHTDDHAILAETVRRFLAEAYEPRREAFEQAKKVDRAFWRQAGEVGLLGASIPEAYGGFGGDITHDAVIFDEIGKLNATGFGLHVHMIAAHYILAYGSEEQKQRWLPRMVTGELIAGIAMTEPGTGSDLKAVRTRAVRDGDHYVLNGAKTFISNGVQADLLMLVARTGAPDSGARGLSLLIVETTDLDGFRRGRTLDKIGQAAQDTAELFFEDARVPVDCRLGAEDGLGFAQLMEQLGYERLILAITAVGVMDYAIAETVAYTRERKAFGQAVAEFQNTRFQLAEAMTEAHIGRVFVDNLVERQRAGTLDVAAVSMAKWWTTEKQCAIVDACLQLHGGYGYMMEYPIARMYVDSRVQKIYGGTNEIMKELISRTLLS